MFKSPKKQLTTTLSKLKYEYLEITKKEDLLDNLRECLIRINPNVSLSIQDWDRFIQESICNPEEDYIDKLKKIQGIDFKQKAPTAEGISANINLVDKKNIYNNKLQFIDKYSSPGNQCVNDDSVTILVNGFPLVHIDLLRNSNTSLEKFFNTDMKDDWKLQSWGREFNFFDFIEIFIISNQKSTRYFSCTTFHNLLKMRGGKNCINNTSNSYSFTSTWRDKNNEIKGELIDFATSFLQRENLLNVIFNYSILVCAESLNTNLKVMRPYQIYAVEAIRKRIIDTYQKVSLGQKDEGKYNYGGGYIWHATGSGKTLTSFKACKIAASIEDKKIDKVLFVVDRKDLDYQTQEEYRTFETGCFSNAQGSEDLIEKLTTDGEKFITTTVQKLYRCVQKLKQQSESFDKHVVIIFDECHRTQFGRMHELINSFFVKSHIFGFTGTPIFDLGDNSSSTEVLRMEDEVKIKKNTTEQRFGDELHRYTLLHAINDEKVLKFKIGWVKATEGDDEELEYINEEGEEEEEYLSEDELCDTQRISQNVYYILSNFNNKTLRFQKNEDIRKQRQKGYNSILTVSSIKLAQKYYCEFQRQLDLQGGDKKNKLFVTTIFSSHEEPGRLNNPDTENPEIVDAQDMSSENKSFLKKVIEDYNESFYIIQGRKTNFSLSSFYRWYQHVSSSVKAGEIDILIVVNMFLTGFDATKVNTLWVDKDLYGHNLIQAFSRTNRIAELTKTHGNIECFRTSREALENALRRYVAEEGEGIDGIQAPSFEQLYYGDQLDPGYKDLVEELSNFPLQEDPEATKEEKINFLRNFGKYLDKKQRLLQYDEFKGKELVDEETEQKWQAKFMDISAQDRKREEEILNNLSEGGDWEGEGDFNSFYDNYQDYENYDIGKTMQRIYQQETTLEYIIGVIIDKKSWNQLKTPEDKEKWKTKINIMIDSTANLKDKKEAINHFIDINFDIHVQKGDKIGFGEFIDGEIEKAVLKYIESENSQNKELGIKKFLAECLRDGEFKRENINQCVTISFFDWWPTSKKVEKAEERLEKIFKLYYFDPFFNKITIDRWLNLEAGED